MTVLVLWPEENFIFAASDTRISASGMSGFIKRTDSGAKLFSIPVVCRPAPNSETFFPDPIHVSSLGFGFAGHITPATMTALSAITLLQKLSVLNKRAQPPTFSDIVEFIRKLANKFFVENYEGSNGTYGQFEAVIFGPCPQTRKLQVFHLSPLIDLETPRFEMETREIHLTEPFIIGSGKKRLEEKIKSFDLEKYQHIKPLRPPQIALEELIKDDDGDVGGTISMGFANIMGYEPCWVATRYEEASQKAWRNFNGIDLDEELGEVGGCWLGATGMSYLIKS